MEELRQLRAENARLRAQVEVEREERELLRFLVDSLPDFVSYVGRDMRYRFCNRRYAEIAGRAAERVVGMHASDVLGEEALRRIQPHVKRALGGELVQYEESIDYRFGADQYVDVQYVPRFGPDSEVRGFGVVVRNITAEKKAQEALRENAATLENRVRERTEALRRLNEALERENEARKTAEQAVRQKGEQLRRLARSLIEAQEIERRNLSRELHDDIGQILTAVRAHASVIRNQHSSSDEVCPRSAQTIMDLSGHLYDSVHRIMRRLRPRALDDLGLAAALQSCIDSSGLEAAGIGVHASIGKGLEGMDENVALAAYRVVQEALTNVVRHADARNVWIRVVCKTLGRASDAHAREVLEVSIEDDGMGLPEEGVQHRLGILGLDERIQDLGGDLVIRNRPPGGVFLGASIPVRKS
jgi:PAS domain S-box-containing protein